MDHDLPVLVVKDLHGNLRAVYTSYACHCVTLSSNKISGDWAGFAQAAIQRRHPGTIARCPSPAGRTPTPVPASPATRCRWLPTRATRLLPKWIGCSPTTSLRSAARSLRAASADLPLADLPSRAEWQKRLMRGGAVGYHARVQLARLESGRKADNPGPLCRPDMDIWRQPGNGLFAGRGRRGLRAATEAQLDPGRLWLNAYANDAPCYIPSERVLVRAATRAATR